MPEKALEPFVEKSTELPDSHHQRTMKDGRCFICSAECIEVTELKNEFPHLVEEPRFKARLAEIGELINDNKKAEGLALRDIVRAELEQANRESRLVHFPEVGTWLEKVPEDNKLGRSFYADLEITVAGLKITTKIKGKIISEGSHPEAQIGAAHLEGIAEGNGDVFGKIAADVNAKLSKIKSDLAFYETKRKKSKLSLQELRNLNDRQKEIKLFGLIETNSPFGEAFEPARLRAIGEVVPPEEFGALFEAQQFLNELNKKNASYGDHSVAWSIIAEQVQGGYKPGYLGKLHQLHKIKGQESIQILIKMARYFEKRSGFYDVAQRIMIEAIKNEEAILWANEYATRCTASKKAALSNTLPDWAVAKPEFLESLNNIHKEAPRYSPQ